MKKFFLTLVVFSVLFVIGCQENSITDPLQVETVNKIQPSNDVSGTITLNRLLNNPYPVGNSGYLINGQIQYELTVINKTSTQSSAQYYISVHLCINADLTEFCTFDDSEVYAGSIVCVSNDEIFVSGPYMLDKSYIVEGREDGMALQCQFSLTTKGIELDTIWLELETGTQTVAY